MFDSTLIKKINSGRCFALVGSGPSSEIGYPSWENLARAVWENVLASKPNADNTSFQRFLEMKDYPACFRQAEVELGNRDSLPALVRTGFKPPSKTVLRPIYEYLSKWPFACYLTTNYDNELQNHLSRGGHHFQVVQNSIADLSLLRDGVSNLIVKLHADLDHSNDVVLTSKDYDRALTSPEGNPFRVKLRQVFEVFDILIIGHSMSDPDLQLVLATAKHTATPRHPIFMVVANATTGEVREYLEKYNIRLIVYTDTDGTHRHLKGLLSMADHFVCGRDVVAPPVPQVPEEEIQAASSLLMFRRLRTIVSEEPIHELVGPLVLGAVAKAQRPLAPNDIASSGVLATLAKTHNLTTIIPSCVDVLVSKGLLQRSGQAVQVTTEGRNAHQEAAKQRELEEQQAYGQFKLALKGQSPGLSDPDIELCVGLLRDALIGSFRARGLALANVVIGDHSINPDDLSDLFAALAEQASRLPTPEARVAFIDAARAFLIEPNEPQKKYLASVSQGFFLYHLAGADPHCARIRSSLFTDTCWFLDSSVLLPLLAVGCYNHEYAVDLFSKLTRSKATLLTTHRLIREAWTHLQWAANFIRENSVDSPEFLMAAMAREGYKQNLFLDGYVRMAAEGTVGTFRDYLDHAAPSGMSEDRVAAGCRSHGITALTASDLKGFEQKHWGDIEDFKAALTTERKQRGTFRSALQVEAEAELLAMIRKLRSREYSLPTQLPPACRFYFVSQSRTLDKVASTEGLITWNPEAVYRYVSSLPGAELSPDFLQQCMLHEYFYAGVSFVDKARYLRFFGPSISQAKTRYRDQVDKYLNETEQTSQREEYDKEFERTPDLEKPFFVAQMGWHLARTTEEKAKIEVHAAEARVSKAEDAREQAEARAKAAEADAEAARKKALTAQHEANRLRNLDDPKHAKKRERQAKARARKKGR
ncbi:MAG: SIR2 family protein [Verrucomicrobiia bacterium]